MSSCLCKKAEGTVPPFVLLVVTIEDGIDDPVHAGDIHEANHRPSSSAHFHKAALDHVGGAQLAPERPGKVEEGEQLGQILLQPLHHRRVDRLPASSKATKRPLGLAPTLRPIDRLRIRSHRLVISFPHVLQNVPHLMHPAALRLHLRIDGLQRGGQARATVGDDQQQVLAAQAAPIQIVQKAFPGRLALALAALKGQQPARAIRPHPVGHQHLHALSTARPPHPQAHAIQEQVRPFILQRRLLKRLYQTVQMAAQLRDRLRAHDLARQDRYHPPHLPRRDAVQERLPNQQHHFLRPPLKSLQARRPKASLARARHPQTQRPQPRHEIALVKSVAIAPPFLPCPLVVLDPHRAVPLLPGLLLQKLLPSQPRLPYRSPQNVSFRSRTKCSNCSVIGVTLLMGCKFLSLRILVFACYAKPTYTLRTFTHTKLRHLAYQHPHYLPERARICLCHSERRPGIPATVRSEK